MSRLKEQNVTKCVSLLREFIGESSLQGKKKDFAILALNQLQKITAGTDSPASAMCLGRPKADGTPRA
ncbi:MAG: hypothetical protein GY940_27805 [bacterium]|nr:hypothetical protein [bacterium]